MGAQDSDRHVDAVYTYSGSGCDSLNAIPGVSVITTSTISWKKFQAATVPGGIVDSVKHVDAA